MPSARSLATVLGWLGAAAGAAIAYSFYVEPRRFSLRQHTIHLEWLPAALHGLRLLHISDIHLHAGERDKIAMLRRLQAVDADLVVITGDFTDFDEDIDLCVASLAGLRGRYGTFAVLGNHDICTYHGSRLHFWREEKHNFSFRPGVSYLVRSLREAGIDLLRNESRRLPMCDQPLWIVGVDDPHQSFDDLPRALKGVPAGAPVILLAHSPEVLAHVNGSRPDLVLAGHTHGGQIVLPFVGALVTRSSIPLEKPSGLFHRDATVVHISPGLGGSIKIRFNRPPEAQLLVLKAGRPHPRPTAD